MGDRLVLEKSGGAVELLIRHGGVEKREEKITAKCAKETQRIALR